jgi:proline iminopeptidase
VAEYSRLVFGKHKELAEKAAHAWNSFEGSILKLTYENQDEMPTINYPEELARARVQLHYIKNKCFVEGDSIINSIKELNEVPTVIVQGQYDMVCPPLTADDLYTVMPHADFRLVPDAGHSASEPGITHALIDATDIFKRYL